MLLHLGDVALGVVLLVPGCSDLGSWPGFRGLLGGGLPASGAPLVGGGAGSCWGRVCRWAGLAQLWQVWVLMTQARRRYPCAHHQFS